MDPKGEKLPGRWIFLRSEPWQGAPFYETIDGRPRILAVVRLAVADTDRMQPQVIQQHVRQTLRILLGQTSAATDDEREFRQDGLVLVLLPGESLTGKKYDQFGHQMQF